jgi:hypothetical protein
VRLWLDGRLVVSSAGVTRGFEAEVELSGRPHALRVEYLEINRGAHIRLSWAQKDGFPFQPILPRFLFHERASADNASVR